MPGNRRPLIRVLDAVGLDPPANTQRSQEQIFLNYALQNLERLQEPIEHVHCIDRVTEAAAGGPNVSGFRLHAVGKAIRVSAIINFDGTNPAIIGWDPRDLGTWTPHTPDNVFGGTPTAVIENGFINLFAGITFPLLLPNAGDRFSEADFLMPLYPGSFLYGVGINTNDGASITVVWDEPL